MLLKCNLLIVIALSISTFARANDEWILRIIDGGKPSKLVALLVYLESHAELAQRGESARLKLRDCLKSSPLVLSPSMICRWS
jgi:hypothetical protein